MMQEKGVEVTQYYVLPVAFQVAPKIALPKGAQAGFLQGAVRWSVAHGEPDPAAWREVEYQKVQNKINSIGMRIEGKQLTEVALEVAKGVHDVLPDRDISVMLGVFGVEYKCKEKG